MAFSSTDERETNILGTLNSNNLMFNPNVPRQSEALGARGSDGRAYTRTVDPRETVRNQMESLLGENSRYMRINEQNARNYAASRGLGNSSIAAGAGRKAAIESSMPIAQQDAATYAGASEQNVDALNSNVMQERDIANRILESGRDRSSRMGEIEAQIGSNERMQRMDLGYRGEQAAYDRQYGFDMAGYQTQLQDMFANSELGRELTRMGADYQWRDTFANNDAARQDWLSSEQFNREFYGTMSTLFASAGINSTSDFMSQLNAYALENPDVFNAEDYTNFGNFANQFMEQTFARLFESIMGGGEG